MSRTQSPPLIFRSRRVFYMYVYINVHLYWFFSSLHIIPYRLYVLDIHIYFIRARGPLVEFAAESFRRRRRSPVTARHICIYIYIRLKNNCTLVVCMCSCRTPRVTL